MVIALLEQLARPVACFVFSAEILRPPHPFVAPCITRVRQALFVRNSISHAFPYRVREDAGFPQSGRCLGISIIELINSPLVFCAMRVSDRETEAKNYGDTVTCKQR